MNVQNWEKKPQIHQKGTAEQERKETVLEIVERFWEYWDLNGFYGQTIPWK